MAVMAKILIITIQESAQNSPELFLLKFLPSTYTITAISWPPPLISQLFPHWPF